jgi:hypothetical protein
MMSSNIRELQQSIDKFSVDIRYQKKVLRDLEHRKSVTQGQLNAVRDPVQRLPLEISSEILLQCLPSRPKPGAQDFPMLFLNVCNSWKDIAISTPALWAAIHADEPLNDFTSLLNV